MEREESAMRGIKDKIVMVTGAAGGIGRATAKRFLDEGARLILCDLAPLGATGLDGELGAEHGANARVRYVEGDVASTEGLAVASAAMDAGLDVLVNNAGITRDASVGKLAAEDWDKVIAVNLTSVFRLSQAAAARMKAQKRGVILNAASVVAHNGNFGQANYVASKAGVIGLTKTLARELGRSNIRVNAVAPGFIETPMTAAVPQPVLASMSEKTPLQRLGKPEEIAAVYCFLASDDASYITGAVINVDGGLVV
jgi:3-oxoacyl-[acyl-carrier protein] reductase